MEDSRPPLKSFLQKEDLEPEVSSESVIRKLRGPKGDSIKGDKGDKGEAPTIEELEAMILPLIPDPIKGKDGKDGERGERGFVGEKGDPGVGLAGVNGIDGKDGSEITPKEVIEKINKSRGDKIKRTRVEGLDEVEGIARTAQSQVQNFISLGGSRQTAIKVSGTILGTGINTINFVGATGTKVGDGSEVNVTTSGSGGGQVNSIVAGTNITVDSTDPANPIVSATGGGSFAVMVPTGTIDGSNVTFVFSSAPSVIVLDNGTTMNKTNAAPDSTANWTGTTTVTLAVAPNFNIFGY